MHTGYLFNSIPLAGLDLQSLAIKTMALRYSYFPRIARKGQNQVTPIIQRASKMNLKDVDNAGVYHGCELI